MNDLFMTEGAKIIVGIFIGTFFTTWYKDFHAKKEERKNLFLRMVAAKSYVTMPQTVINDMNMVEVLFRKHKKILEKYRLYYEELCLSDDQANPQRQKALYWDLLREMGNHVGYKHLDNKTLNSRYIPVSSMSEHDYTKEFRQKILKFLTSADQMHELLKLQVELNLRIADEKKSLLQSTEEQLPL